jgi:hypothetical protein
MPSSPAERLSTVRLAGGSTLSFGPDGTPVARRMNGDQLFAEQAADGKLVQVEDGVEERLPPDPGAVFGGVRGHDALLARQQCSAAVRVHARKTAAASPALVRRMPASRPAARRPRASAKRSSTRDDDDGDGEPEPAQGRPEALAGPSPRFRAPWRPELERQFAECIRALDRAQEGR